MGKCFTKADSSSALEYTQLDHDLGRYFGKQVEIFMAHSGFEPDFISSHGHTVFHQPEKYLTTQIGHPSAIRAIADIPVIADFRTLDVHLGGQGAPLVPIGDLHLFPEYKFCLNLGGIANLSIKNEVGIQAFDVCIANMALNYLANQAGLSYDKGGKLASKGTLISSLLKEVNSLDFHHKSPPKSMGKEWFDAVLKPILKVNLKNYSKEDLLSTVCESIAQQIASAVEGNGQMLVSGGGAKNTSF